MTTKLRISIVAALLPAMAALGFVIPSPQPGGCAAIVVHSLSSSAKPVKGSFGCLSEQLQFQAAVGGYDGDAGLQKLAQERGRDHARYIGSTTDGGYVFELSGAKTTAITILIYLDKTGKVYRIDSDQGNGQP